MTPQTVLPIAVPVIVLILVVLRNRRPRPLRPGLMWIAPLLVTAGVGAGLYFQPHGQPFGPAEYAICALGLALGAVAGWWRGKTVAIARGDDGGWVAQASPIGMVLILGLFGVRFLLRQELALAPDSLPIDPIAATDALLLFAVAMVVVQRIEMLLRVRALGGGGR